MVTPQNNNHPTINIDGCAIERTVQAITSVTSEKFVTTPSRMNVLSDLLIGLKRFRNAIRWKAFFQEKAEDIMRWIQTFQLRVDDLCDSNGL